MPKKKKSGIPFKLSVSVRTYIGYRKTGMFRRAGGIAGFGTETTKTVSAKVKIPLLNSPYNYQANEIMRKLGYDQRSRYDKKGRPFDEWTKKQDLKFFNKEVSKQEKIALKERYGGEVSRELKYLYARHKAEVRQAVWKPETPNTPTFKKPRRV